MPDSSDQFVRFLRAVHRRLVMVRAVERAGVCVGVAAGFAAVLTLGMWWEGRDALAAVGFLLALGGVIGLAWGLARRPGVMAAAMEADRQLGLADLLGTALAALRDDNPWSRSVVAMAEARVRTLAPGAVILHRYGGRAWGGIGLSAALVLTLGAMSSLSRSTQAQPAAAGEVEALVAGDRAASVGKPADAEQGGAGNRTNRAEGAVGDSESGPDESAVLGRAENASAEPDQRRSPNASEATGGVGSAVGRTDQSDNGAVPTVLAGEREAGPAGEKGEFAGGVGRTDPSATQSGASGFMANGSVGEGSAGPWESGAWSGDRARAEEAVRSGRVPDTYRDVVRGYFRSGTTD